MLGVPPIVFGGAAAVVASIPLLIWAMWGRRASTVPESAVEIDHRHVALETGAVDRIVRPVVEGVGRRARRLTPKGWVKGIERRLSLAGPSAWTVERVLAAKLVLLAGGVIFGWMWTSPPTPMSLGLTLVLGGIGYVAPDVLPHGKAADRREAMQLALPDTLDQLTISVEAGLGFDAALQRVAASGSGPLADELQRTVAEIAVGIPRNNAFRNLINRTDVTELRHFVLALQQAEQYGLPIARVLRIQASELRLKRRQRAEEKAMKIPVKIVFPLVMCIFPALFIVLLGPAAIRILRTLT
jgi:tight adherence protein C